MKQRISHGLSALLVVVQLQAGRELVLGKDGQTDKTDKTAVA